jgi:Major Facilitator Superfamily
VTGGVVSDRRTLVSMGVQFAANGFVYSTYLSRLPEIRDQAGISIGTLGVVMMVGNLAGFVATFFTTPVVARLGSRRVMTFCGLGYVLALPIIGLAHSPAVLIAALVALMIMNVMVDAGMALQASMFSNSRPHPVMNRLWGLYSLGTVGGGLLASTIASWGFDVTGHLVTTGLVLAAGVALAGPGLLPDPPAGPADDVAPAGRPRRRWRVGRFTLLLGIASAVQVPLDIVPGEWATFRITDDLGSGAGAAAVAYFAFAFGMTAGRLGGDFVQVRLGAARLAWVGTAVSTGGLLAAALVPRYEVVLAGFLVAGLGISVISPLIADAAAKAPGRPGAGLRVMFVGDRLAGLLTPLAIGPLAATPAFTVGTAMSVVVVPSAVMLVLSCAVILRPPAGPAETPGPRRFPASASSG